MNGKQIIKTTTTLIVMALIVIVTNNASAQQISVNEANMQMVTQLIDDYFVNGDTGCAEALLSEGFVAHDPLNGDMDRATFLSFYNGIRDEMTDYELLAGRGMVAQIYANAQDFPPLLSPEHFDFGPNGVYDSMVNFFLVQDGQIVEAWLIYDRISLRDFTGVSTSSVDPENNRIGFFNQ